MPGVPTGGENVLINLKKLREEVDAEVVHQKVGKEASAMTSVALASLAIAERLDELCRLIGRGQNPDGSQKVRKPL